MKHAAWLVIQAIEKVTYGSNYKEPPDWSAKHADPKINRSYGTTSRGTTAAEQDHNTGAVTEVLCTMTVPLLRQQSKEWVNAVNVELQCVLDNMSSSHTVLHDARATIVKWSAGTIQVFGRAHIPDKKFNAEADVVHRRVDYCIPADLLLPNGEETSKTALSTHESFTVQEHLDSLQSFPPGNRAYRVIDLSKTAEESEDAEPAFFFRNDTMPAFKRPNEHTLKYLSRLKKLMQGSFQTQVEELDSKDEGALLEKSMSENKRKNQKAPKKKRIRTAQQSNESSNEINEAETTNDIAGATDDYANTEKVADQPIDEAADVKRLLRRKRYHNFSPNVLAHDYLAYRRVDRFYHRGTIRATTREMEGHFGFNGIDEDFAECQMIQNRPFFVFSLKGDVILHQQCVRVVG
jgi:hypothetical protein